MQRIVPPIQFGARSRAAENLVKALIHIAGKGLITAAPANKIAELVQQASADLQASRFGPSTSKLLRLLQVQSGILEADGRLDDRSAAILNSLLEQNGGLEP